MKIFLAIPTVSNLGICPHPRLLKWAQESNLKPEYVDNFMPQWAARREIVRRFLASNAEDLLMIDYDTVPTFPLADFYALWKPRNIIAGHYALHTDQGMFQWSVGKAHPGCYRFTVEIPESISEWDVCGFGCVSIPRSLVQNLFTKGAFSLQIEPGHTEDTPVCEIALTLGAKIVTSPKLRCEHWRTIDISCQLEIQNVLIERADLNVQNILNES